VSWVVELVVVILLPTAIGYGVIVGIRAVRWAAERRSEARWRTREEPSATIEQLAARQRRLRDELAAMETGGDLPAKQVRLHALRAAYRDTATALQERGLDVR